MSVTFLPPQRKLWEGNVFTGVFLSTERGRACVAVGGGMCGREHVVEVCMVGATHDPPPRMVGMLTCYVITLSFYQSDMDNLTIQQSFYI